jgi:2-oxoglutarate dehydrogenase E1 component
MLPKRLLLRAPLVYRTRCNVRPVISRGLAFTTDAPSPHDPFANGTNTYYAEAMYLRWKQDRQSVHASWDAYFSGLDHGLQSFDAFSPPPRHLPNPADGAPALHAIRGAELDDHLKVPLSPPLKTHHLAHCADLGPTPRASVSSARSSCRRVGSAWDPRCGFGRRSTPRAGIE